MQNNCAFDLFFLKLFSANKLLGRYEQELLLEKNRRKTDEKTEVISEAKQILDVEDVIASILLVEDLRIQKN